MLFEPGSKYDYSNSNYVLLGYIIEKVSGIEYGEFLKQNILDPLGMKNTRYDYNENLLKNKAKGYVMIRDINKKGAPLSPNLDVSYAYSAGGLYSTVEDIYKWDQALYTEKLVKKATLAKMFTPNSNNNGYNYGYGWWVSADIKNCVFHYGEVNGFLSVIYRFMEDKLTIIILTNEEDSYQFDKMERDIFKMMMDKKIMKNQ